MAQTSFRFVFFIIAIIFFVSLFAGLSVSPLLAAAAASSPSSSSGPRLRALVPLKVGFQEFVNWTGSLHHDHPLNTTFDGFCVQVFREAMSLLRPPAPAFDLVGHGDGLSNPSYDGMVDMVYNGEADIVVADVTITRDRMEKVDFTLPYIQSSLVMVVPLAHGKANTMWDFLHPFSLQLWLGIGCAFLTTGLVLYMLENKNPEFMKDSNHGKHRSLPNPKPVDSGSMRGSPTSKTSCSRTESMQPRICEKSAPEVRPSQPNDENSSNNGHNNNDVDNNNATELPFDGSLETEAQHSVHSPVNSPVSHKQRLLNAYWFTSLCVFFSQQEYVRTHTGRIVTVAWLFTALIFYSSYTASLASQLSAQQFPTIQRYEALLKSNSQLVGYQKGSFLKNYLRLLGFRDRRLKTYASEKDYLKALQPGSKVGAILDETPYVQILLQKHCNAITTVADQIAYFGGFGFAVRKNLSSLTERISEGILEMAENGDLQKLKDKYLGKNGGCKPNTAPDHLQFKRFAGLFIIFGTLYAICVLWRIASKAKPSWIHAVTCTRIRQTSRSLSRGSRRVADDSEIIL